MRTAVFSDIHGNLEALEAVLADIRAAQADELFCLGDVIGYGADPEECLHRVQAVCRMILRGNHEAALLEERWLEEMNFAAARAIRWTAARLSARDMAAIGTWPLVRVGADARWVHGSPHEPGEFHYLEGIFGLRDAFWAFPEKICFCGHTHVPLAAAECAPGIVRVLKEREITLEPGKRYVINVGSVGQPRDGNPRARWVLAEDKPARICFREVEYDIAAAQAKILKAGLPEILATRLRQGR